MRWSFLGPGKRSRGRRTNRCRRSSKGELAVTPLAPFTASDPGNGGSGSECRTAGHTRAFRPEACLPHRQASTKKGLS